MTNFVNNVPEPEQQKKEEVCQSAQDVHLPLSSSDEESEEDLEYIDQEALAGYQPLTPLVNEGVGVEFHAEPLHTESSDEEMADNTSITDVTQDGRREISVNTSLVLNAMKGVSIPGSNIPPWAKELSDSEWENMIKKTISGEKTASTGTSNQSSTDFDSSTSENPKT